MPDNLPENYIEITSAVEGIQVFMPAPEKAPDYGPVVEFKCPRCAANRAYSIHDGGLVCAHCGFHEAPAGPRVGRSAPDFEFTVDVVAEAARGWGVERKELECQNCGSHTVLPADSLSHTCPFCTSNRVVQRKAPEDVLRPRFLLPFKLQTEDVRPIARAWLGSSWMTPRGLNQAAGRADFTAIYLPAWTFSMAVRGDWTAEVGHEKKNRGGDKKLVWQRETGVVQLVYRDYLTSGTSQVSPALLAGVWDYEVGELVAYEPVYLAGLQAQAYDVPMESAWEAARHQIRDEVREAGRKQALEPTNAKQVRDFAVTVDFADETWRYILLPVHLAAYRHKEKSYQIVVNGQTGAIAGQRPPDWGRVGMALAALLLAGPLLYLLSVTWLRQVTDQAPALACLAVILSVAGIAAALALVRSAARLDDA